MRVLGVIAGIVLVALVSVLFVWTVMPELWLQLTRELPQRLTGVIQTEPAAERWQGGLPAQPSPAEDPGEAPPLQAKVPAPEPVAVDSADGGAREAEADELAQTAVAASGEPPYAVEPDADEPAGAGPPSDGAPSVLDLVEGSGTADRRAYREALRDPDAAGLRDASPPFSAARPQPRGGEAPEAAKTPRAWHTFWRPFRAERSAIGFASHVSQVTGLTIEIRRSPDSGYRVGFPYSDKTELERNIALIEAGTGLRVLAEGDR